MSEKQIPKSFSTIARKKIEEAINQSDFESVTYTEHYAFVTYKNGTPMRMDADGRCVRQPPQSKE